jgi:oxygen-independent coproporphyrinogen-3 oxidase
VGGAYAQNIRTIKSYKERIRSGRFATERGCEISSDDGRRRRIISDIMCHFHASLGPDPTLYGDALARLEPLRADGLVEVSGDSIQVTDLGRPFVRNVAMAFDAYLGEESAPRAGRFSSTV